MRKKHLLFLIGLFTCLPLLAQQHPVRERGFRPEYVYDPNGFDTINVTTGNLIGMIPLGTSYPVGEGLSYGFTLYYTGNLWEDVEHCSLIDPYAPCTTRYFKRQGDNAGFGWRISFGRLHAGVTTDPGEYNSAAAKWRYEGPDGSEHLFWETAHEPQCVGGTTTECDPVVNGFLYTRDISYLRLRSIGDYVRVVEFPDGRRHRFAYTTGKGWRITHMYTAASTVGPTTGVPSDNYVAFTYVTGNTTTGVDDVVVTDTHGRQHTIRMAAADRVQSVVLGAFPDDNQLAANQQVTSTYTLGYTTGLIKRPCTDSSDPAANQSIYALTSLTTEPGENWSFDYTMPASSCDDVSGTLIKATLPTGGRLEWDYWYEIGVDIPNTVTVRARRAFDRNGTKVLEKAYDPLPNYEGMAVTTKVNTGLTNFVVDTKTHYYRRYWWGADFGLPYTTTSRTGSVPNPDATGRYLSTETFQCNPTTNTCPSTADRATYAKYEMDQKIGSGCTIGDPCEIERNRRPFSERTLYVSDGGRVADTAYSRYDGLGHYRQTTTSGTFDSGNARTTATEYNPGVGTYAVGSNGNRLAGFTMLSASSPWLLHTYTQTSATENGISEYRQACFDATTGLLLRQRVLASGSAPAQNDLLTVWTRAANTGSRGSVTLERRFGGDTQSIDTGASLCSIPLPTTDQVRIEQTWSAGALATSRYLTESGTPLTFHTVNRVIDAATGLVRSETDAAGLKTSYEYDKFGRLVWSKPVSGGWTKTTYTPATTSAEAQVEVLETAQGVDNAPPYADTYPTTVMGKSQWLFDGLGRLSKEKRLLENGTWSTRAHGYDSAGRKNFVSEAANPETATGTRSYGFDPYGRPTRVTAADGSETTFAYRGARETDRTVSILASTGLPQSSTTTETYDRQGRLWRVKEPSGASGALVNTTYAYDQGGRLKTVTMAGAEATQTRTFTYDKRGLLQSERHPELGATGNGLMSYSNYDASGRAGRRTDGVWDLLYTYDRAERLAQVSQTSPARAWKTFTYGTSGRANGRILTAVRHNYHDRLSLDVAITETFTYDGIGGRVSKRRTQSSTGPIFEQTFTYDARGNVTTLGYPKCLAVCTNLTQVPTVTNTYTNGFLSTVSGNALGVVTPGASSIDYHANGLVSSVGMNNTVTWQQGIASHWMARPASITTSGATNNLALSNYAYDGAGNITSDGVDAFRYDKVSRLVSGTANGATQTATYDSFGNIKTLGAATLSPVATTNRLPATLASYAANGAVTAYGGDLFDLDPFGMIQAAHDATYTSKYWVFIYTADDERIWKYDMGPANTSWWKLRDLGGKVLSEYVNVGASWTAVSSYIYRDGTLLGRYAPGTSYPRRWFAVDHLGTPRRTLGENGTLIEAASYFPFGGHATTTGPAEESLRFTSHERDMVIAGGIDYMHARFYAPGVGRFLSVDPAATTAKARFPQTWNRYAYVRNNPLVRTDPDGMRDIIRVPLNIIYSEADYVALPGRGYASVRQTTEAGLRDARNTYGRMGIVFQVRRYEAGSLINPLDSSKRNGSVFTAKGAVPFSTFLESTRGQELNVVAAGRLNRGGGSEGLKGDIWLGANQRTSTLTHELGHSLGNAFQQWDGARYLYTEFLWSLQKAIGFTEGFEQMVRATAEEYGCGSDTCGGAWDPERK